MYKQPTKNRKGRLTYNFLLLISVFFIFFFNQNYDQYATQHYSGLWTAPAIRVISAAMVRAYCHKVIKLSDALQPFSPEKEVTEAVHGVRQGTYIHESAHTHPFCV